IHFPKFGSKIALIHVAGIQISQPFLSTPTDEIHKIIQNNITATTLLTRSFLRYALPLHVPTICIYIGSRVGKIGNPGQAIYAGTKSYLDGFVSSLVKEFSNRNVRFNTISPGYIDSPMLNEYFANHPNAQSKILDLIPLGEIGRPQDIAHAAHFLNDA